MSEMPNKNKKTKTGIRKSDFSRLKKALGEVITINWQYQTCGLNRDNFLLCL